MGIKELRRRLRLLAQSLKAIARTHEREARRAEHYSGRVAGFYTGAAEGCKLSAEFIERLYEESDGSTRVGRVLRFLKGRKK